MLAFGRHNLGKVALLLFGSAIFICSCSSHIKSDIVVEDKTKIPSVKITNLTSVKYKNGKTEYRFTTPLLERYEFTERPYMEFKKGIQVETFNDSTKKREMELTADYAIYLEKETLWEAKGNVIAKSENGKTLYTEQLFWNTAIDSTYSNVDTKLVDGDIETLGSGFWSDGNLSAVIFTESRGVMEIDTTEMTKADTTAVRPDSTALKSQ